MNIFSPRTWLLGIKSLALHPLRSMLTVLGIFIGTSSVIWLLAIGEGISRKAQEQIAGLGANNIIVRTVKPPAGSISADTFFVKYGITREDYDRLVGTIPTITRALRIRELPRTFRRSIYELDGRLVGCTRAYAEVMRLEIARGRFISDIDLQSRDNVCVLAAGTARKLFPIDDPIGQAVQVDRDYYVVVGITKERSPTAGVGGSLAAQDFSKDIYIPITTLWNRVGDRVYTRRSGSREGQIVELSQITLRVNELSRVQETADIVRSTMQTYHPMEDYGIVVPLELLEQAQTTRWMFMLFMGAIAAISLLVGGIGIMNIMLATVTERTKEIGIRRALGATRLDVVQQFLVETVSLSVMGGMLGVLGGIFCGPILGGLRDAFFYWYPDVVEDLPDVVQTVEPVLVPMSIPLAFIISVMIGVVFGLYPAIRAAWMDPIEALRHE